jgi:hypothetical protein
MTLVTHFQFWLKLLVAPRVYFKGKSQARKSVNFPISCHQTGRFAVITLVTGAVRVGVGTIGKNDCFTFMS